MKEIGWTRLGVKNLILEHERTPDIMTKGSDKGCGVAVQWAIPHLVPASSGYFT